MEDESFHIKRMDSFSMGIANGKCLYHNIIQAFNSYISHTTYTHYYRNTNGWVKHKSKIMSICFLYYLFMCVCNVYSKKLLLLYHSFALNMEHQNGIFQRLQAHQIQLDISIITQLYNGKYMGKNWQNERNRKYGHCTNLTNQISK